MDNPVIVVVRAGPGIGAAVARRFGHAGYDAALIARSADKLRAPGRATARGGDRWTALDISEADALTAAIGRFGRHTGSIRHLHFNPSAFMPRTALEITLDELHSDLAVGAASLLTAVQAALPFMSAGGLITATRGVTADRPWLNAASLRVQKAALRNIVTALGAARAPDGTRAMTLTVVATVKGRRRVRSSPRRQ